MAERIPDNRLPLICPACGGTDLREVSEVTVWGHVTGRTPEGIEWSAYEVFDDYASTGNLHCTECGHDWTVDPVEEYSRLRKEA